MSERMRDTTVIQERTLAQKDLPQMTATKLADKESTAQSGYYQRQTSSQFVRFAENTACKLPAINHLKFKNVSCA